MCKTMIHFLQQQVEGSLQKFSFQVTMVIQGLRFLLTVSFPPLYLQLAFPITLLLQSHSLLLFQGLQFDFRNSWNPQVILHAQEANLVCSAWIVSKAQNWVGPWFLLDQDQCFRSFLCPQMLRQHLASQLDFLHHLSIYSKFPHLFLDTLLLAPIIAPTWSFVKFLMVF